MILNTLNDGLRPEVINLSKEKSYLWTTFSEMLQLIGADSTEKESLRIKTRNEGRHLNLVEMIRRR